MKSRFSWLIAGVASVALLFGLGMLHSGTAFSQSTPAQATAPAPGHPNLVDINTATMNELKGLPGIGDTYAQKIINGRPYSKKSDLLNRRIIPSSVYNRISSMIVARRAK